MVKNCFVWFERGREKENGDDVGGTQHGVRGVKAVARAQDGVGRRVKTCVFTVNKTETNGGVEAPDVQ